MPKARKSHPPSKGQGGRGAIKAHKTAAQIAQMFGVHPTQVGGWKKQALAGLPDIFDNGREQMRPPWTKLGARSYSATTLYENISLWCCRQTPNSPDRSAR